MPTLNLLFPVLDNPAKEKTTENTESAAPKYKENTLANLKLGGSKCQIAKSEANRSATLATTQRSMEIRANIATQRPKPEPATPENQGNKPTISSKLQTSSLLYFRRFVAQVGCRMTRRFFGFSVLILFLALAQIPLFAEATSMALAKSAIFENDVAYLRVGEVGKNLADEIQSAQIALASTNKIAGTVLDLRFADGDDSAAEQAVKNLFASKKLPLAILINAETRGTAVNLASDLRGARAGLIFGNPTKDLQPDILVSVNAGDEKDFLENPFGTLAQNETNSSATTNDFLPFVDHTSEGSGARKNQGRRRG
jgi:hypothetical protein